MGVLWIPCFPVQRRRSSLTDTTSAAGFLRRKLRWLGSMEGPASGRGCPRSTPRGQLASWMSLPSPSVFNASSDKAFLHAALAISWFQERGVILEITSLLIHDVESPLLSGMQLMHSNLEPSVVLQGSLHTRKGISVVPRYSARLEAVMQGMCWTECDGHVYNVILDAAMWVLLYASNKFLDTTSSSKVISSYFMCLGSQDWLDGFAAHCWEYQNWNYLLCVNLWSQVNIIAAHLLHHYVHTQQLSFSGRINLDFGILQLQIGLIADVSTNLELIFRYIMASTIATHERNFLCCFSCTCLSLSHDRYVEDAVSMLFGLHHRRCPTTPLLLIPRFDSGDPLSLSSVKAIRYPQLSSISRVHILDRLSGEPPAGHQLDRTVIESLKDYRCGKFESGLSTDERTPYGSICDLQHLPHEFRSSFSCVVQLGTYLSCSTVESHVMMYLEP